MVAHNQGASWALAPEPALGSPNEDMMEEDSGSTPLCGRGEPWPRSNSSRANGNVPDGNMPSYRDNGWVHECLLWESELLATSSRDVLPPGEVLFLFHLDQGTKMVAIILVLGRCWRIIKSTLHQNMTQQPRNRCFALFGSQGWGPSRMSLTPCHGSHPSGLRVSNGCNFVQRR
jgi:hypothetical protein